VGGFGVPAAMTRGGTARGEEPALLVEEGEHWAVRGVCNRRAARSNGQGSIRRRATAAASSLLLAGAVGVSLVTQAAAGVCTFNEGGTVLGGLIWNGTCYKPSTVEGRRLGGETLKVPTWEFVKDIPSKFEGDCQGDQWVDSCCPGKVWNGVCYASGHPEAGYHAGWQDMQDPEHWSFLRDLETGYCQGDNARLTCCPGKRGFLFPAFDSENTEWNRGFRAFLYIVALLWVFQGVAILCDAFMNGIEAVTSQTKQKTVPCYDSNGQKKKDAQGNDVTMVVTTEVWNASVANLTLMALGSSTPEIMLSIIEIVTAEFFSGDLGPGTVVGSAAFNLFVITSLCISALPDGESRRIDVLGVFVLTSVHSLVAYGWLVVMVMATTPDVVDIWEAVVTLMLLPWLTFWVWCADRGWFKNRQIYPEAEEGFQPDEEEGGAAKLPPAGDETATADKVSDKEHVGTNGKAVTEGEPVSGDDVSQAAAAGGPAAATDPSAEGPHLSGPLKSPGKMRGSSRTFLENGVVIQQQNYVNKKTHVSYAKRRHDAMKQWTGGAGKDNPNHPKPIKKELSAIEEEMGKDNAVVQFDAPRYAFMEDVGEALIKVVRTGVTDRPCRLLYETHDGTAVDGKDYTKASGVIEFAPGVQEMDIAVGIIEDENWNEDKDFTVTIVPEGDTAKLGANAKAFVTIVDVDNPGEFSFLAKSQAFLSTDSKALLVVQRRLGCSGDASVHIKTRSGTAAEGTHFQPFEDTLHFTKDQAAKTVAVKLLRSGWPSEQPDEPTIRFFVDLSEPKPAGGATLGENVCVEVLVMWSGDGGAGAAGEEEEEEDESWAGQFRKAMSVNDGEDVESVSSFELTSHYITVFWKLFAACIPPPTIWGGWATFWCALLTIMIVTALIMDLASIFGCLIGLEDAITAITFVALGTSVPDTFASMMSARQDENADNSIGNITGSNSVNVFLGLGLPWLFAAIYWEVTPPTDLDKPWARRRGLGEHRGDERGGGRCRAQECPQQEEDAGAGEARGTHQRAEPRSAEEDRES